MLEKVYQSEFVIISVDDSKSFTMMTWTKETFDLEDHIYRKEVLNWIEALKKYQPRYVLDDARLFSMPIAPETQEWAAQVNNENKIETIEKYAIVMPKDYISNLSTDQNIEEVIIHQVEKTTAAIQQFDVMDTAMNWLGMDMA
ncbi:MAG TPA: hypothetical protein DCS93_24630 [Microscillaceae bacterium]|nr:hypothetical protein [Microscillaceae bacterium]